MLRNRARLSSLLFVNVLYSNTFGVMELGHYILITYSMAVVLDTLRFCTETAFYRSNLGLRLNGFNLYVMGNKYMLSLLPYILVLLNRVENSHITSHFVLF